MFPKNIKMTNSSFKVFIASLLMICFILMIIMLHSKIILHQLKYKGDVAYEQGVFGDAEVFYRKAIKKVPGQYPIQYNLGNAYYKQERYTEAIGTYLQALKTDNDSLKGSIWNNLGNAYYKQNKLLLSIKAYKNALLLVKDNLKVRQNFLFVMNKLEYAQIKIIPVVKYTSQNKADKKNGQSENENKDSHQEKSNSKNSSEEQKISEKNVNDLFKVISQNEDAARTKISNLKHAPIKMTPTEPDY
jgi:Ca-activated chloride channel family protein